MNIDPFVAMQASASSDAFGFPSANTCPQSEEQSIDFDCLSLGSSRSSGTCSITVHSNSSRSSCSQGSSIPKLRASKIDTEPTKFSVAPRRKHVEHKQGDLKAIPERLKADIASIRERRRRIRRTANLGASSSGRKGAPRSSSWSRKLRLVTQAAVLARATASPVQSFPHSSSPRDLAPVSVDPAPVRWSRNTQARSCARRSSMAAAHTVTNDPDTVRWSRKTRSCNRRSSMSAPARPSSPDDVPVRRRRSSMGTTTTANSRWLISDRENHCRTIVGSGHLKAGSPTKKRMLQRAGSNSKLKASRENDILLPLLKKYPATAAAVAMMEPNRALRNAAA